MQMRQARQHKESAAATRYKRECENEGLATETLGEYRSAGPSEPQDRRPTLRGTDHFRMKVAGRQLVANCRDLGCDTAAQYDCGLSQADVSTEC